MCIVIFIVGLGVSYNALYKSLARVEWKTNLICRSFTIIQHTHNRHNTYNIVICAIYSYNVTCVSVWRTTYYIIVIIIIKYDYELPRFIFWQVTAFTKDPRGSDTEPLQLWYSRRARRRCRRRRRFTSVIPIFHKRLSFFTEITWHNDIT